jgi:hypothetical protein
VGTRLSARLRRRAKIKTGRTRLAGNGGRNSIAVEAGALFLQLFLFDRAWVNQIKKIFIRDGREANCVPGQPPQMRRHIRENLIKEIKSSFGRLHRNKKDTAGILSWLSKVSTA